MCGRFALTAPASTIAEIFQIDVLPDVLPRYNIAPTTEVACVVQEEEHRVIQSFRWGLIPFWAKDKKIAYQTINARAETLSSKPAFRAAFKKRRLLVLTDGFYEWERKTADGAPKKAKDPKIPHLFQMADGRPFAFAGLWERWTDPMTGEEVRSCSIITTSANELMDTIHDRMPVILPVEAWETWLDPRVDDTARLQELLVPFPSERMKERRVSRSVGDVKNKGADVQGPYEE
jgi:putative SOS response-associated peptidase YedK